MIEYIPLIVTGMIFYDFSIHFVYLLHKEHFFLDRNLNWWPEWDMWGRKERAKYQLFWNIYWGLAFLLMVIWLVF